MENIKTFIIGALVVLTGVFGFSFFKDAPLGATPGSDFSSESITVNGVPLTFKTSAFESATTTVCALQAPSATSTLVNGSARFTVSSTTAATVVLAKATTRYATTTSLGKATIGASAQGTVTATTTPTDALDEDKIFAPNDWLVVGMQGGSGTFSPTGSCSAQWMSL